MESTEKGILYIVATPIGNLEDITLRAIRILGEVDVVFCEDTRVTRRLFEKYEIKTHLESLNARTESNKTGEVLEYLAEGKNVAYVSDAGTPAISDPGSVLVESARAAGAHVVPIPGASALTSALSVVGVGANEFVFFGFLPHKKGRQTKLKEIAQMQRATVVYESTHRIVKLLSELEEYAPEKTVCIIREMTKIYEEILCGTAHEIRNTLESNPEKQKGEFVVVVK